MNLPGYDAWKLDTPPYCEGPDEEAAREACRPTAEDWENACHHIIWKSDPSLFDRIQDQAQHEYEERTTRCFPVRSQEQANDEPF